MPKKLPKKQNTFVSRKELLQKKNTSKNKKTSKSLSQREKNQVRKIRQKIYLIAGSSLGIILVIFSGFVLFRFSEFNTKIENKISLIDQSSNCKKYIQNNINSFITVNLDSAERVKSISLNLFDREKAYSFDLSKYEFQIDNGGNTGTINDYIRINNLFLDKKTLFQNLSNILIRQAYIKVDYIIISKGTLGVNDAANIRSDFWRYVLSTDALPADFEISSDICKDDLQKLFDDFYMSEKNIQQRMFREASIGELFPLTDIRKEQLRVYLNNKTGAATWGEFYEKLLEGYGINVVKLDNSLTTNKKTVISVDDENLRGSRTFNMIKYILGNQVENVDVNTQTNIFSDIYIELGEDSLIIR